MMMKRRHEKENIAQAINLANETSPTNITVCECKSLCPTLNLVHADLNGGQREADDQAIAATPVNFTEMEKTSPLCKLKLLEDSGLKVEYRCLKCRDCPDCKNAMNPKR